MEKPNPELEPDAPDWSNETSSDELLAEQLQERGMSMSEVVDPGTPGEEVTPEDSPPVEAPDTSPPEEATEGEGGSEEEDDGA